MTRRVRRSRQGHGHNDEGATAVIVAILTVVLFGLSALAVELTDMFSRDRAVQTTADLAAFAGGQDLPDSCAAFNSALASLNEPENGVRTAGGDPGFAATAGQMSDGDEENGEIQIFDASDRRITSCTTNGRSVRVVAPPRRIEFAFANVMPGAADSGEVQAVAKVELRGLDSSVMPMSLPSNCPAGSNYIYVKNGGGGASEGDPEPDYEPNGHNQGPHVAQVDPDSSTPPGPATIVVSVNDLREDPAVAANSVAFDFHLRRSDGSTLRSPSPGGVVPGSLVPGSVTSTSGPGQPRYAARYTVNVPFDVQTTSGSWKVRAVQAGVSGSPRWTDDDAVGTLTVGLPSSPGCPNPSTGDFGLLTSPREGANGRAEDILNIIFGIDHDLVAVANPVTDQPCVADTNPYPDGILDDNEPARGGESCVDVKPGATVSLVTAGLIEGVNGEDGRLVGSPGPSSGGDCRVAGDPDLQWQTNGEDIVNTVLSCYLSPGSTLNDVRNGDVDSLVADIWEDPRFFYLPVTDTSDRPKNSAGGAKFWPIKEFRGAFITNEVNGGDATCVSDSDCNGLTFNGGGTQIKTVQAFTFPLSALPEFVDQPGNGTTYIGGSKDLLLVE